MPDSETTDKHEGNARDGVDALRQAISSRWPAITKTFWRDRGLDAPAIGHAPAAPWWRSRDCRRARADMAARRLETLERWKRADEALAPTLLPRVTLCMVTHNSEDHITAFTDAVCALDYPVGQLSLVVVDNGSTDATRAGLATMGTRLAAHGLPWRMVSQGNLGFGAGQDAAIRLAESELVLLVNPDAAPAPDSLRKAVTQMRRDDDDTCAWEFTQRPHPHPKYVDPVSLETAWNAYACVLLRRTAYLEVGGFEPAIFLYGEDVDLSYRLRAMGYRLRYVPDARVVHDMRIAKGRIERDRRDTDHMRVAANLWLRRRFGSALDRAAGLALLRRSEARAHDIPERVTMLSRARALYEARKGAFIPLRSKEAFPFSGFDYTRARPAWEGIKDLESTPLVSVITRTHVESPLTDAAIASVANQSYPAIEHIVVEDGLNHSAVDARVRYVSSEGGRGAAADAGVAAARGEYVLFLDYDDLLFPEHVEALVAAALSKPGAVGAYAMAWEGAGEVRDGVMVDHGLNLPPGSRKAVDADALAARNPLAIQSVLLRRDAYVAVGGMAGGESELLEDWSLWRRVVAMGTLVPSGRVSSLYFVPANIGERARRNYALRRSTRN